MTRITGTVREYRYTFWIIYRSVLLKMRIFSEVFIRKFKIQTSFSVTIFQKIVLFM
jgi:hypothetical protein